jgi:hypothetical protein
MRNKIRVILATAGITVAVIVQAVVIPGCEEAKGLRALGIIPKFADLTSGFTNFTQTFEVNEEDLAGLSLPLEWTVANPQLGGITSSGGRTASYTRTGLPGDNSIFVRDQLGAEGSASIRQ